MWGSSVFSKAASPCFVTEEAALVNLYGKLQHRAGWQRRKGKYLSSPLQYGESAQGEGGGERMRPCHSFLFPQHKVAVLQKKKD